MQLLRAWREMRRFQRLDADERSLVFYSESRQDWHRCAPILQRLTREHGRTVCYVSSDADDLAFAESDPQLLCFHIPEGPLCTLFFQTLRADVLVLTVVELDRFELERSLHPVHYVYLLGDTGGAHRTDRPSSRDSHDTMLCIGPDPTRELEGRPVACAPALRKALPLDPDGDADLAVREIVRIADERAAERGGPWPRRIHAGVRPPCGAADALAEHGAGR